MNTNLDIVVVTQGSNGYPQGMYEAITADTISELHAIHAQEGGEIVMLRKCAGWQLWEKRGNWIEPNLLNMKASDSDTVFRYRKGNDIEDMLFKQVIGDYANTTHALSNEHEDANVEELIKILTGWKEMIDNIRNEIVEGTSCDIWLRNPNPSEGVNFSVDDESTSYIDDVWRYQLAIIKTPF